VHISADSLKNIKIYLPPLPEQTAIAERLTAADKELELLTRELEQQKLVKKWLMQQLLTGRIRVGGAAK
jgi:type I restriction enzyme S subunit